MNKYEIIETGLNTVIKKTTENGSIYWIPMDEANSDYQAYLATLASESANDPAGNL